MRLARPGAVNQLWHDAQTVLLITRQRIGIEIMLRLKLAQTKTRTAVTNFMPQHAQSAKRAHLFIGRIGIGFVELTSNAL